MTAETYVLLDTNLLPTSGNIESTFWRSVQQLCRVKSLRLSLVDVVLDEDVNRKTELAKHWSKSLSDAQKGLSSYIDFSTYIPSPEAVAAAWRKTLTDAFEIVPLHGDDAIEALRREALRIWPAQDGKGARDSAIWLTAVRLVRDGHHVILLTNNVEDFGRGGLHADLSAELVGLDGSLDYKVNVQHFVDSIAEQITPWTLDLDAITASFETIARAHVLSFFDLVEYDSISDDDLDQGVIEFSEARVSSSYVVEGRGLARLRGVFTLSRPNGPTLVSASFDTWTEFEPESSQLVPAPFDNVDITFR